MTIGHGSKPVILAPTGWETHVSGRLTKQNKVFELACDCISVFLCVFHWSSCPIYHGQNAGNNTNGLLIS